MVTPCCLSWLTISQKCWRVEVSIAEVGSSKNRILGRPIRLRTKEKRRFCPPDSLLANWFFCLSVNCNNHQFLDQTDCLDKLLGRTSRVPWPSNPPPLYFPAVKSLPTAWDDCQSALVPESLLHLLSETYRPANNPWESFYLLHWDQSRPHSHLGRFQTKYPFKISLPWMLFESFFTSISSILLLLWFNKAHVHLSFIFPKPEE